MSDKIQKGAKGELLAAEMLRQKGFEIIERNYRFKRSEIDLIVKKDNWLVFVEVRVRNSNTFGYPEQTISQAKRKKVMEGAAHYLEEVNWTGNVRYDVVAIHKNDIRHFEDAFY